MSAAVELSAADLGLPAPAYRTVPAYVETDGPWVAEICKPTGLIPDPLQQDALDAMFGVDEMGEVVAYETALIACRQNIKTSTMEMAVIAWVSSGIRLILWSSHRFRTSGEAFRDIEERFAADPSLRRRVKRVWRGSGDECIEMKPLPGHAYGSRVMFQTRSRDGSKGLTGDKVILDEGFALQEMHMGALLPTMSTRIDPQILYGSSAGYATSAVLRDVRDRGRSPGSDPQLAYFEWCAPDPEITCEAGKACTHAKNAVGCGCDNPEYWRLANPAMFRPDLGEKRDAGRGHRISSSYIRKERRAMPPAEFGRERMGWWDDPVEGVSPLTDAAITRSRRQPPPGDPDRTSEAVDPVAIGLSVAMDRSMSAVGIASWRPDGRAHVELADHRPGTAWVLARLIELAGKWKPCCLVLKPGSPAGSFENTLLAPPKPGARPRFAVKPPKGWPAGQMPDDQTLLHLLGAQDYAQACGAFADELINDRLRHLGLPPPSRRSPLEEAMRTARTHFSGGSWIWSPGEQGAEITPLEAVTVALHGLVANGRKKEPPGPFALFGKK